MLSNSELYVAAAQCHGQVVFLRKLYACKECGLHFTEKYWAKKCEEWDKKYRGCSLEIAGHSVEAQKSLLK